MRSRECRSELQALCAKIRSPDYDQANQISLSTLEDDQKRFDVWANNLGAFQDPRKASSLDHRLREAPQIGEQVLRLLDRLGTASKEGRSLTPFNRFGVRVQSPFEKAFVRVLS